MMNCERYTDLLDGLLDDALAEGDRAGMADHLSGCADCRAELEAARSLRAAARSLPREIAPSRDLWPGIAARIEGAAGAPAVIELDSRRQDRARWTRWAPLAAAAVLLVVVSSSLTVALIGGDPAADPAGARAAAPAPAGDATTAFAAFRPAEIEYKSAVRSLEAELAARRESLAPETVEVIETNLLIIDRAIAEATAALAADPGSTELPLHLSDVYRQKVELLRSAIMMQT